MRKKHYGELTRVPQFGDSAFLRVRKAPNIVDTPKSDLRHFESALLEKENWSEVSEGFEARLVGHPDAQEHEKYVLCRSTARAEKEKAMLARQSEKLASEFARIHAWLERCPQKDQEQVGRRIGRAIKNRKLFVDRGVQLGDENHPIFAKHCLAGVPPWFVIQFLGLHEPFALAGV